MAINSVFSWGLLTLSKPWTKPRTWRHESWGRDGDKVHGPVSVARLSLPEVRIECNEARIIHLKIGDKSTSRALVPIGRSLNTAITLIQRLESETGEPQPGRPHHRLLSNGQIQPPDRQQVGRRAEVEVKINTACHLGAFFSIHAPAVSGIN